MSENLKLAGSSSVGTRANAATLRTGELRLPVLDGLAQVYKTPLTAILAASAGLGEIGGLSPTQADLVALIEEQARRLSDLTTRLLVTARLDATEAEIHTRQVGVEPIIDDAVAGLRPRLASRKLVIDLEDDNLMLCCDRQLILVLLTQFIENACKFSTAGTAITIRAKHVNSEVVLSVHNFGPVIPLAEREGIFVHYSLPSSLTNQTAETGFGLSVARRIASVHGGNVWVTSEEGEGTTFFAGIPSQVRKRCSS